MIATRMARVFLVLQQQRLEAVLGAVRASDCQHPRGQRVRGPGQRRVGAGGRGAAGRRVHHGMPATCTPLPTQVPLQCILVLARITMLCLAVSPAGAGAGGRHVLLLVL